MLFAKLKLESLVFRPVNEAGIAPIAIFSEWSQPSTTFQAKNQIKTHNFNQLQSQERNRHTLKWSKII